MPIIVDTITAPACWASALVNGDYSSFSLDDDGGAAETAAIKAWLADLAKDGWSVVSTTDDEPRFTWSYALHGGTASGGEVLDYVIHKVDPAPHTARTGR